jgi:hypothetical protein
MDYTSPAVFVSLDARGTAAIMVWDTRGSEIVSASSVFAKNGRAWMSMSVQSWR